MTMTLSQLRLENLRLDRKRTGDHDVIACLQPFADDGAIADHFTHAHRNGFESPSAVATKYHGFTFKLHQCIGWDG